MSLLPRLASLLHNISHKADVERDLDEELSAHVAMLTEQKMHEGMSAKGAQRAALIEVGGVEQVKEQVRTGRAGFALETLAQDIRYGMRSLLKKRGFTLTAVIALGIGANTAIFSVINGVLLRSLAYPNPGKLVMLWEANASHSREQNVVSPANYLDWQKQSTSFEQMAAAWDTRLNVTGGGGEPEEIEAQRVSAGFFSVLGVQQVLGRGFTPEEDQPGNNVAGRRERDAAHVYRRRDRRGLFRRPDERGAEFPLRHRRYRCAYVFRRLAAATRVNPVIALRYE